MRSERAERFRRDNKDFFDQCGPEARAIIGTGQFTIPDVLEVPPIPRHGNVKEIAAKFGGTEKFPDAVQRLQNLLYAASTLVRQRADMRMITGQSPRIDWQPNPSGKTRRPEEAKAIAENHGVVIPDDVEFFPDELNELHKDRTACGPRVDKLARTKVVWSDLVHDRTGKVPFRFWPGILNSDEAIVAVFAHEMFELEKLRPLLKEGKMAIEDFIEHTRPGNPGNLHDQAWDYADALVERMRKGG